MNLKHTLSFKIFMIILIVALFTPFLANDTPLLLKYKNHFYFPIFQNITDKELGGILPTKADFHDLNTIQNIQKNGFMIMPPIPYGPNTIDYNSKQSFPAPPCFSHWLGTTDSGQDILALTLYALRISLIFGILLTFFSSILGIFIGAVCGYFGGMIDLIIGRIIEIWQAMPALFILMILACFIAPSFLSLLIILTLFNFTTLIAPVRSEVLKAKNQDYVLAAKASGYSSFYILYRHILPNALVAPLSYLPFILASSITALTALDFLGLGMPMGTPSLGALLAFAKENIEAPWILISSLSTLSLLLILLIFLGEAIRKTLNKEDLLC